MSKAKVIVLTHLRDKNEAKIYQVVVEGGDAGEYYSPKGEAPFKIGDEVEYTIEASDFGPKFKLAGSSAPKGGGGFARKSIEESALISATALVKELIAAGETKKDDVIKDLYAIQQGCIMLIKGEEPLPF